MRISRDILNEIVQKCGAAAPDEACGILFGADGTVSGWVEAANVAADPRRHFEIDPVMLIAALRAEREGGERVLGYWHSHPSGDVQPSATDAAMAAPDGRLWLIVAGERAAVWRPDGRGGFDPVAITTG